MKSFDELKEGDKLYRLAYWSGGFLTKTKREWDILTIKKKHKNKCILKGGYKWTVTRKMYGDKFFDSKIECAKRSLNNHLIEQAHYEEELICLKKEIKYLNNLIKKR